MSSAKITYNKRSIKMYLHKFLKTPAHIKMLVSTFYTPGSQNTNYKTSFYIRHKNFLRARLITRTYYFQMGYGGCNSGVQNQLDFIINVCFCKRFLPCLFTCPKMFWMVQIFCPRPKVYLHIVAVTKVLCQTKR